MENIPFLNLRESYLELSSEIDHVIKKVLKSGKYILGEELSCFESEWAEYCGAKYAVGVGNGLDALYLSLLALDIGPGDEVIVPTNTYIATWLAVSRCGAIPVPVEPNELTYNIDVNKIESAITSRTKALVPVHLYGQPCDLDVILDLSKKYNLHTIEDAAQSHGARYKDKRIGSHGDIVTWSFYPGKNLGAFGDAGAITTNNEDFANRIKLLRNYGSKNKYVHEVSGFNSRLDPLQAAVLRVKLKHLDSWNTRRSEIAKKYLTNFTRKPVQSIRIGNGSCCPPNALLNGLVLPVALEFCNPVWHLFVVRHENRDSIIKLLNDNNIETLIHYPIPPHKQSAYNNLHFAQDSFPIAERISKEMISLPIGPQMNLKSVDIITNLINKMLD